MEQGKGLSRRALFGAGAGLAAAAAVGTRAVGSQDEALAQVPAGKQSLLPPDRIGLQLYSLRDDVSALGFTKVLETVAEIGFKQIEFAGYTDNEGTTLPELRGLLDRFGLVAAGSHVSPSDDASMATILDEAEVLHIPQVGISLLAPGGPPTTSGWSAAAADYNRYGELAHNRGVGFYLHNHFQEWLPCVDDPSKRGIDVLLEETDPRFVFFELDIFWAHVGRSQSGDGFDPLNDYAIPQRDRFRLFHVKDGRPRSNEILDVGEGEIDFQTFFTTLFAVAPDQAEKHLYLWERDSASDHPRGPLAAARSSFVNMRHGLFAPGAAAGSDGCRAPAPSSAFRASIVRTRFRRGRGGRRVLRVVLDLGAPAQVTATLTRGRKTLAGTTRQLDSGRRTVDLPLPRRVRRGNAALRLSVGDGATARLTLRDDVRVPRLTSRSAS